MNKPGDTWNSSDPYEYFMGRWSNVMAPVFLNWLNAPYHLLWLDLGCGTGALSEAICRTNKPAHVSCIDPSATFLQKAKERLSNAVDFTVGSASNIPKPSNAFDIIVCGLALNFFPDITAAFAEMKRVLKPGGTIAAYVWDYAGRMDFLRLFWDAACAGDPEACKLDEGIRFSICSTNNLSATFAENGLANVETTYLDITTVFKNTNDYWQPFLGAQGPAPSYVASLTEAARDKLKTRLLKKVPVEPDGSIKLLARAIAVRGNK